MVKKKKNIVSKTKSTKKVEGGKQSQKNNQTQENMWGSFLFLWAIVWLIWQIPGCFSYDCHDEAMKVRMCTYELDDYVNHNEKGLKKYKECVKMYRKWENKCVSKEKREKYKALDDNFFFLN